MDTIILTVVVISVREAGGVVVRQVCGSSVGWWRRGKVLLLPPAVMDHSCMQRRGIRLNYGVQRGVEAAISPLGEGKREISVYA